MNYKEHQKRWKSFAKTNEGRSIWFLHKQGYKFCEYLKDLTPEQRMFLIISNNLEVDEMERDENKQNPLQFGSRGNDLMLPPFDHHQR